MFPSRASDMSSIDNHRGHRYQFIPAIQTLDPSLPFSIFKHIIVKSHKPGFLYNPPSSCKHPSL